MEPDRLRISFLNQPIGILAHRADTQEHALQLDRAFIAQGHDLSPISLPLESFAAGPRVFRAGDSPFEGGLPGLIVDSIPDAWGARMLKAEAPVVRTVLGRLAKIGLRGPGALTFDPVLGKGGDENGTEERLDRLAREAHELLKTPAILTTEHVNEALAKGGGSLGGVHPKVSAHLPLGAEKMDLERILVGGPPPEGLVPCVVKLSPLDEEGGGAVEFAFWRMARQAGLHVPRASLVHDGERRHFAVERFDRRKRGALWTRRHIHTISGLLHRRASDGAIDYSDFMRLSRRLAGSEGAEECFRRAVFNLLATNRDDHGRNHAFLYDESDRTWSLSPAYDLNPNVSNVLIALSWLGGMQIPTRWEQLLEFAEIGGIAAKKARQLYDSVEAATEQWGVIAKDADVPARIADIWQREMLQQTKPLRQNVAAKR